MHIRQHLTWLMMNFNRLEKIAKNLIVQTKTKRCYHFSFILKKNRIVAIGSNVQKTHPKNLINRKTSKRTGEDYSQFKHTCSEFSAINRLKTLTNINSKKCTLINIRYDRNMQLALAKPCMSCESLLDLFDFKKIIWSNNEGFYNG